GGEPREGQGRGAVAAVALAAGEVSVDGVDALEGLGKVHRIVSGVTVVTLPDKAGRVKGERSGPAPISCGRLMARRSPTRQRGGDAGRRATDEHGWDTDHRQQGSGERVGLLLCSR